MCNLLFITCGVTIHYEFNLPLIGCIYEHLLLFKANNLHIIYCEHAFKKCAAFYPNGQIKFCIGWKAALRSCIWFVIPGQLTALRACRQVYFTRSLAAFFSSDQQIMVLSVKESCKGSPEIIKML